MKRRRSKVSLVLLVTHHIGSLISQNFEIFWGRLNTQQYSEREKDKDLNFHGTKKINDYTLVMREQVTHKIKTENNTNWVSSAQKKRRARVPNPLGAPHEKQQCSLDA